MTRRGTRACISGKFGYYKKKIIFMQQHFGKFSGGRQEPLESNPDYHSNHCITGCHTIHSKTKQQEYFNCLNITS